MQKDITYKTDNKKSRIVLIREMGKAISGKNPVLLFSTSQIEEILNDINIYPAPFAPDYLLGFCLWHGQIMPVVDAAQRYDLETKNNVRTTNNTCYIVVKTVQNNGKANQLVQGILKLPKQIVTTQIPESSSPGSIESYNIDQAIVKGIFEYQDDLMIVPDLLSIFNPK